MQTGMWKTLATIPQAERTAVFNAQASALTNLFDIHEKRINDGLYNRMGNKICSILSAIARDLQGSAAAHVRHPFNDEGVRCRTVKKPLSHPDDDVS